MGETPFHVELTEAAAADLFDIDEYWTQRGEGWRGKKYYWDLRNKADRALSDRRGACRGRLVKNKHHPGAREILAFEIYRITYQIDESTSTVSVLRFWHSHRGGSPLE